MQIDKEAKEKLEKLRDTIYDHFIGQLCGQLVYLRDLLNADEPIASEYEHCDHTLNQMHCTIRAINSLIRQCKNVLDGKEISHDFDYV